MILGFSRTGDHLNFEPNLDVQAAALCECKVTISKQTGSSYLGRQKTIAVGLWCTVQSNSFITLCSTK